MTRKQQIYRSLTLDTLVSQGLLRNDATYLSAVAEKIDVCSSRYANIVDIMDWLCENRFDCKTIEELVVLWENI